MKKNAIGYGAIEREIALAVLVLAEGEL